MKHPEVYLNNLSIFLEKILLDNDITQNDIDCLNKVEKEIYKCILKRKGVHIGKENEFILNENYVQNYYKIFINKRRNEEYLKYIFMQGIKFLKTEYIKQNHMDRREMRLSKSKKDEAFYKFYFQSVCQENNIKLESFYLSKKKKQTNNLNQKSSNELQSSINSSYRDLVMKSHLFINDFKLFLNNNFKNSENKITGINDYNKEFHFKRYSRLDLFGTAVVGTVGLLLFLSLALLVYSYTEPGSELLRNIKLDF